MPRKIPQSSKRRPQRDLSMHPPQFFSNPPLAVKYRFQTDLSTESDFSITGLMLGQAFGAMNISATQAYPLFSNFKIKRMRVWSTPSNGSSVATITVKWSPNVTANALSSGLEYSDTTVSPSIPAFLDMVPPPGSNAAFWSPTNSTVNIFNIESNTDFVLDLDVEVVLLDNNNTVSVITVSGATTGAVVYAPLDGRSGVIFPVGRDRMT